MGEAALIAALAISSVASIGSQSAASQSQKREARAAREQAAREQAEDLAEQRKAQRAASARRPNTDAILSNARGGTGSSLLTGSTGVSNDLLPLGGGTNLLGA